MFVACCVLSFAFDGYVVLILLDSADCGLLLCVLILIVILVGWLGVCALRRCSGVCCVGWTMCLIGLACALFGGLGFRLVGLGTCYSRSCSGC